MKVPSLFMLGFLVMLSACKRDGHPTPSTAIKIISLTASVNPVIAYDTSVITVVAEGENLQYGWIVNHGRIKGSGPSIKYSACQSCTGLNTISCRVFNETGEVSDTIMIRVNRYQKK